MSEFLAGMKEQVTSVWGGLNPKKRAMIIGGTALLFVALLAFAFFSTRIDFQPLYTDMRPEAAGEVLAVLKEGNVKYTVAQDGRTILVPRDQVYEVRLQLAKSGLPRGGVVGLELWDQVGIGETEFDRKVKYLRALQGELTRTILEINAVASARVHVVLPERSLFANKERDATASVFIERKPGAVLTAEQIASIAHLMATSVEGLTPDRVTIIDNNGNILSDGSGLSGGEYGDQLGGGQKALNYLQVKRSFEKEMEQSLVAMLERVFGYGKVVLRVNASLNLDFQEENLEIHEPIVKDSGLVLSEQESSESFAGKGGVGGAAGTTSNIPGYAASEGQDNSQYERKDTTRNYVVNKKESRILRAPGRVERLSVAVWLDGSMSADEQQAVSDMVASAVGLQPSRGDVVQIQSVPFKQEQASTALGSGLIQQTAKVSGIPVWALAVAGGVILLLAMLGILKRRRNSGVRPVEAPTVDITVGDDEEDEIPLSSEDAARKKTQDTLNKMASEDAETFVALLRAWLGEE